MTDIKIPVAQYLLDLVTAPSVFNASSPNLQVLYKIGEDFSSHFKACLDIRSQNCFYVVV